MTNDSELRRRYLLAIDDVLPASPWLEARVANALRQEKESGRRPGWKGAPSSAQRLRIAAGLAVVLLSITVVTALVFSARLLHPVVPTHRPTPLASPTPTYTFTPSATTRSANWPAGGPVPADLAGCWQSQKYANNPTYEVCLGKYSFDFGQGFAVGNVVVNGSEIDFISDICTSDATYGYDRYTYTLNGGTLTLTKLPASGTGAWGNCGWRLAGSYAKVPGT